MKDEDLKEAVELLKKMDKETLRIFYQSRPRGFGELIMSISRS